VTKDLNDAGINAPDLAKSIGAIMGGGGGGRPHLATAGGKDKAKLKDALKRAETIIKDALKGLICNTYKMVIRILFMFNKMSR
jgi:alanyl-tRNA synthetase